MTTKPTTRRVSPAEVGLLAITTIQFIKPPFVNAFWTATVNAAHVPWFAMITVFIWWWMQRTTRPILFTGILCLAIALGTEFVQSFTDRVASPIDVLRDLAGAAIAGIAIAVSRRSWPAAVSIVCLALVGTFWRSGHLWLAANERDKNFPELLNVKPVSRIKLWANSPYEIKQTTNEAPSLTMTMAPVKWPGLTLLEPVADWQGYSQLRLVLEVHSSERLPITLAAQHVGRPGTSARQQLWADPGTNELVFDRATLAPGKWPEPVAVWALSIHTQIEHAGAIVEIKRLVLE